MNINRIIDSDVYRRFCAFYEHSKNIYSDTNIYGYFVRFCETNSLTIKEELQLCKLLLMIINFDDTNDFYFRDGDGKKVTVHFESLIYYLKKKKHVQDVVEKRGY